MVYRIYPALLFSLCVTLYLAQGALVRYYSLPRFLLFVIPFTSVAIGYLLSLRVATICPRIRYSDAKELDAQGHVHEPVGPLLLVLVIGVGVAISSLFNN